MRIHLGPFFMLFALVVTQPCFAGVFNTAHFVSPGEFALGIEPELVTSGSAAFGVNVRYTQGISDLSNGHVIIGTGSGARQFRVGLDYTFDFIPDLDSQPGFGVAFQGMFVQLNNVGTVEVTAIPYAHKNFKLKEISIEPFLSIPVGLQLAQGAYQGLVTLVGGGLFHHTSHVSTVLEVGIGLSSAYTYVSGGVVYFH
jgi:hypothetical protein